MKFSYWNERKFKDELVLCWCTGAGRLMRNLETEVFSKYFVPQKLEF